MDTIFAIAIIGAAAYYVYTIIRKQLKAKKGGGCGCAESCSGSSGQGCCQDSKDT